MDRTPEPELMDDDTQARAYSEADFEGPNALFMQLWEEAFGDVTPARMLDLGCGPADIPVRMARRHPALRIDAADGSEAMLRFARTRVNSEGLGACITLMLGRLPEIALPRGAYDAIISNSLLHHLSDPAVLWQAVKACARPGAAVLVMDLVRPPDEATARALVDVNAANEPEILRHDFLNSLRAAYRRDEVRAQLESAGLGYLEVSLVSDRHLAVTGFAAVGSDPNKALY